jgi:beta-glucosidase
MSITLDSAPFRDPSLPTERRVEDLLARMTLAEKVAQLGGVWSTALVEEERFSAARAAKLLRNGAGQVTRIGGSTGLKPREIAAFTNDIQRWLVEETRLGIPTIVHEESTGGLTARDADQFPHGIALASTWDPDLAEAVGAVIRAQMVAVGARHTLAPVLDVARDPRWGRVEETYGEDPYLASRIGVGYVRGVQGGAHPEAQHGDLSRGVAATGKHFLGYGLPEGGHNHKPAHIGPRELREVYARPFLAAIHEAGLRTVMNAYNEVDGLPCGGAAEILDDLLRGELGFDGLVAADYFTTRLLIDSHRVAGDKREAARMALEAGLDVELPSLDCYPELVALVDEGIVATETVDRSVRRVLRLKLELGLFESPYVDAEAAPRAYQTEATRALARRAAVQSLVLLRNEGALLPLSRELRRIAVLGPAADDVRLLEGDYHYPAHLEILYRRHGEPAGILPRPGEVAFRAGPFFPPMVTPLEGIRAAVRPETEVIHVRGCGVSNDDASGIVAAVAAARRADVAVLCLGGRSGLVDGCTSGEFRDAASLRLTGLQERLAAEGLATGTPTAVVLLNGRVLALADVTAPALVEAWLPGEEGGHAIADVLFGAANPSGRLPVSLPRDVGQVPIYHSRKWATGKVIAFAADYIDLAATPLFPFGHGLSYTRFEYADLAISSATAATGDSIEISLEVRNAGDRAGAEVVQLYVQDVVASVTRPIQQLAGFARVELDPGEKRHVTFHLDSSQLAFYDRTMRFVVEPGDFGVRVGASSEDIRLEGSFRYEGEPRELDPKRVRPTVVRMA